LQLWLHLHSRSYVGRDLVWRSTRTERTLEGTDALTDQPTRARLICPPRCPAGRLGCPVCHGSPQGFWSLLCWFDPWRSRPFSSMQLCLRNSTGQA